MQQLPIAISAPFSGIVSVRRVLLCAALVFSCAVVCQAQNAEKAPPVIDVHVHAMDGNFPGVSPMCPNTPQFLASDPKDKEERSGWAKTACTPALYPSAPGEYMKDVLAEMERLNVIAVVMGDPKSVQKWKDAAPNRVINGTGIDNQATATNTQRSKNCASSLPLADSK